MIVTVTMNPAIDKTLDIDRFEHGGLNRIQHVELDAGGKGINVSKTIHELGGESIVTGFIAGNTGKIIRHVMDEWQIENDFVEVSGETRTNTKVYEQNGLLTELNEPGPEIQPEDLQKLLSKLDGYAKEGTLFVLAGSVPKGIGNDIYQQIIEMVHKKGAKVLLDADGELFRTALSAKPDIIKPNRVELERYEGMDYVASEAEVTRIAEKLTETVDQVVVSMGKSGAIFLTNDMKVKCPGLNVKAHSTVGAGDAMVAGLSYAWDKDLSAEETVKICMAVSAGAVTTIGTKPPSRQVVDDLMKQVEIQPI